MMNTRKLTTIWTLVLMIAVAGMASADVLWDQTAGYEGWQQGFFNNIAGAPPFGATMYTVNDVVVPLGGWTVDTLSIYYDGLDPSWEGAVTTGVLYVEPKTGPVPTGDPSTGTSVALVTSVLGNGFMEVTAAGLGLSMAAGEYWIGVTPNTPNANNIHVSVPAVGDDSPTYDAFGFPMPMWSAWAPGLDGAMLIEGAGPVATEATSFGTLKSLYR